MLLYYNFRQRIQESFIRCRHATFRSVRESDIVFDERNWETSGLVEGESPGIECDLCRGEQLAQNDQINGETSSQRIEGSRGKINKLFKKTQILLNTYFVSPPKNIKHLIPYGAPDFIMNFLTLIIKMITS